jgi:hypothetical protein
MSRTKQMLIASLNKPDPDEVDDAVFALHMAVVDLIEYRSTKADRVFDEEALIRRSISAAQGLLDDMWNAKLEAAE